MLRSAYDMSCPSVVCLSSVCDVVAPGHRFELFGNILHRLRDADTIRYDSEYLTCSKKLTGSQLTLPHGINRKLKCETKNKMMSVISPVRSRYREAVQ